MLCAYDIVLFCESEKKLNGRLETGIQVLEVSNEGEIIQVTWFKYLGSLVQDDGKIERDVIRIIQIGW